MNAYPANSLIASGSVTAPGAGGVIASITAPPEGVYEVVVYVSLSGAAETALTNVRVRENTNAVGSLLSLTGASMRFVIPMVEVNPGGGNVDAVAVAAATAGAVYNVTLIATRVG